MQHQRVLRSHRKNQDLKRSLSAKSSTKQYLCRYCFIQFDSNEEQIEHVETEHFDKILEPNVKIDQEKTANNVKRVFQNNEVSKSIISIGGCVTIKLTDHILDVCALRPKQVGPIILYVSFSNIG